MCCSLGSSNSNESLHFAQVKFGFGLESVNYIEQRYRSFAALNGAIVVPRFRLTLLIGECFAAEALESSDERSDLRVVFIFHNFTSF